MVYVGTSGWVFQGWRERFYPRDVPQKQWLRYYAERFSTVELNASTYRLPSVAQARTWSDTVPDSFKFTIKLSRLITHRKSLPVILDRYIENFFDRIRAFDRHKVAQILVQFPPSLKRDDAHLDAFLGKLPLDFRYVVEFRNQSWFEPAVRAILERHHVAFCIHDFPKLRVPLWVTNPDLVYLRLHGYHALYAGSYPKRALSRYVALVRGFDHPTSEIFIYFNNDTDAAAPHDAQRLVALIGAEHKGNMHLT